MAVLGTVVVARVLGPGEKGGYDLLLATTTLLVTVLGFSLPAGITYVVARGQARTGPLAVRLAVVALAQGALGAVLLLAVQHTRFSRAFVPPDFGMQAAAAAALFLMATVLAGYCRAVLIGRQEIVRANMLDFVGRLVLLGMLLITAAAVVWLGYVGSAELFVWTSVAATVLASVLWLRQLLPTLEFSAGASGLREVATYAFPSHLGNLAQFLNYRVDVFLVGFLVGVQGVGLYTVAVTLAQVVWLISNAAASVLLPKVASVQDAVGENVARTVRVTRLTFWFSLGAGGLLALSAHPLVTLVFGSEFRGSLPPLLVLLPGVVALSTVITLAAYLAGIGRPQLNLLVAVAALVVTVTLDLVLIPRYGIVGAAWASTLSYVTTTILTARIFVKLSGASAVSLFWPTAEDVALVSSAVRKRIRPSW
jgi:O-antigen/teichoic acid export membrane protein